MIILKRNDGISLNLSGAVAFYDHRDGMIAEMPAGVDNEWYQTSIASIAALQEIVDGRFATMITIPGHFHEWPKDERNSIRI